MQSLHRAVSSTLLRSLKLSTPASLFSSEPEMSKYSNLLVHRPAEYVVHVELNRPKVRNALNRTLWSEIGTVFEELSVDKECRAIVISGAGSSFCAGIDLKEAMTMFMAASKSGTDVARTAWALRASIDDYQRWFTNMETCLKPVIACTHGAVVGAGIDLITACDIRLGAKDAVYSVREVDIGLCADVGTLARLPKIIGSASLVRELCLTARDMYASEALSCGLTSRSFDDKATTVAAGIQMAGEIAAKSPVAVQGTKYHLNYARDHSVNEALEAVKMWNMSMLQSEDVVVSAMSAVSKGKDKAVFAKL